MRSVLDRLTYANVISTLALFLVLAGGVAYAAKVGKKSVGPSQLKASAVTTAKIKANAVTTRKIRRNAVSNAKIKDGAIESQKIALGGVQGSDIDMESTPFGRVTHRAKGTAIMNLTEAPQIYPLGSATYTQAATESDTFIGALDVTFPAGCEAPRKVTAFAALDSDEPTTAPDREIVALGEFRQEVGSGTLKARVELGPSDLPAATRFEPGTQKTHALSMVAYGSCESGSGISANFGAVNVIGTK